MKYFVLIIQKQTDDSSTQAIYAYDTLDAAKSAFHSELAYAMNAKALKADFCEVIDEVGNVFDKCYWQNSDYIE